LVALTPGPSPERDGGLRDGERVAIAVIAVTNVTWVKPVAIAVIAVTNVTSAI